MKKLLILNAVTLLALSAQTPSALPAALRGVSESFRTYSGRNLNAPFSTAAAGIHDVHPDHWWNVAGYGGGQFRRPRHWLPQLDPTGPAAAGYHVGRWKQPDRAVGQPAINGTEQGHWRFSAARPRIRASQPDLVSARRHQRMCDS